MGHNKAAIMGITREELEAAMHNNGKIENVAVIVHSNYDTRNYYRICTFSITEHPPARAINFLADLDIWLLLPNGHSKARECGSREVWLCDIVYRGDHWDDEQTGSYIQVDVFTVHPKERLVKWQ